MDHSDVTRRSLVNGSALMRASLMAAAVLSALSLSSGESASAAAKKLVLQCRPTLVQACKSSFKLQCQAHDSKGCCTKVKCVPNF